MKPKLVLWSFGVLLSLLAIDCGGTPQQKQARHLEKGKKSLAAKNYRRAILDFRNAVQVKPDEAEPHFQMALADLGVRDFRAAVSALQTAVGLNPKHLPAQLKLAELMATSKDKDRLKDAEKKVREVVANSPTDPEALNALALVEFRLGKQSDAESHLIEAFDKAPQFLTSGFNLVRLKLNGGDVAGAEALLKSIVEKNPKATSALNSLAQFYLLTRRPKQAEEWFRNTLSVEPKNGAALISLAELLQASGKSQEAEQMYSRAAALPDPDYKPVHAIFLFLSNKRDEAIREFESLYKGSPNDRAARARLVAAYQATGRTAAAEKLWQDALKKHNNDVDALLQRSRYYLALRKYNEAEADLNVVLRAEKDSAQSHFLLSKVRRARGEALIQRQELTEAVRLKPDFLEARIELAKLLIGMNAPQAALDLFDGLPPSQRNTLGVVECQSWAQLALGNKAAARAGIDRAIAAAPTRDILLLDATFRLNDHDAVGAQKSLETALKRTPEDTAALDMLVQSFAVQKRLPAGVTAIQKYAVENPRSLVIQHFFGQLLLKTGDRTGARCVFETVKNSQSKFVPVILDLAQMDLADGNPEAAAKLVSEMLTWNRDSLQAQLLMGAVEEARNNFAEAVGHYRKALEMDERNAMALNNLAYIMVEYGNQPDEALSLATKAHELSPSSHAVQDTIGWVYYRKGMYSDAVKQLEASDSKQPNATTKLHLGSSYLKVGDRARGVAMLQAALAMEPKLAQSKTFQEATTGVAIR